MADIATNFSGSMPEYYDTILGPAQFDAFAADLVRRLPVRPKGDVLELACGTGIVTHRLRERVDTMFRLVATDISDAMLAYARNKVKGKIDWRLADAAALPLKDETFGVVVCAFGVMFVPDKVKLYKEVRRVLMEGGTFLFNAWEGLELNKQGAAANAVMEALFPNDPEMQFPRIPYSYHDVATICRELDAARFGDIRIDHVKMDIKAPSARQYATGQVRGTPRGALIEKRGVKVDDVIEKIADALTPVGGSEPFKCEGHALVVQAKAI